ncbi:MAG: hypothetical protein KKB50_10175 [Planctomycetes bacterium]|nr:hypothetical protein [Planctomycetota bacterium]
MGDFQVRFVGVLGALLLLTGPTGALAAGDTVVMYLSDQNLDAILRIEDLNDDGDTLDAGEVYDQLGFNLDNFGTMTYNPYTDEMYTGGTYSIGQALLLSLYDTNGNGVIEPLTEIRVLWDQNSGTDTNYIDEPRDLYFLSDGSVLWVDQLYDQALRLVDANADGDLGETFIVYNADLAQAAGQPVADRPQTIVGIVLPTTGDVSCNGFINGFDIDAFVLALSDPDACALAYPDCDITRADINGDGDVNGFDIDPFVLLLSGGK